MRNPSSVILSHPFDHRLRSSATHTTVPSVVLRLPRAIAKRREAIARRARAFKTAAPARQLFFAGHLAQGARRAHTRAEARKLVLLPGVQSHAIVPGINVCRPRISLTRYCWESLRSDPLSLHSCTEPPVYSPRGGAGGLLHANRFTRQSPC